MSVMRIVCCKLLLLSAAVLPSSNAAQAQAIGNGESRPPNFELEAGYSHLLGSIHSDPTGVASRSDRWQVSGKVPVLRATLGVKAELTGIVNGTQPEFSRDSMTLLIGPQVGVHVGYATVFAYGMIGSARLSDGFLANPISSKTFGVAVGGGIDLGMSRHVAYRVTGDFFKSPYQATDSNYHEIIHSDARISIGPVFRF